MSSFSPRVAGSNDARPDPTKHVNYSLGMVLGEDDFKQEFAYLSGRDQWTARDLLGYGTVNGLAVSVTFDADARTEVVITPGAAVSPRGQLIRVTPTQCADLRDWVRQERHRERLSKLAGTAARVPVYVVLSYRECATDDVPIPGEPCRSEEDSMEASRLSDNFRLELSFDPPAAGEEEALRDFVGWLGQTAVVGDESAGPFATREQFEAAVRGAAGPQSPPASPPDYMHGSPPAALRVRSSDACEFLRAGLRIWVTELRPLWGGKGSAPGLPPNEEGVLLAELSVPVEKTAGGRWELQHPGLAETEVDQERRPFVLHLRMLQEWIECGRQQPTPADFVTDGTTFGKSKSAGTSEAYSRADHDHGTPPQLTGDATSDAHGHTNVRRVGGIPVVPSSAAPPFDNQVLIYKGSQWVAADAPPVPLVGDVTGSTDQNELSAMQGVPFLYNAETARQGQVLTYVLVETGEEELTEPAPFPDEEGGLDSPPNSPPDSPPAPTLRPAWIHADPTIQGEAVRRPDDETAVAHGEVLTFHVPEGATQGEWRAAPLPEVTLAGDVEGEAGSTTVTKIRNIPLSVFTDPEPQEGDVLTYSAPLTEAGTGLWSAKPPANLVGDVTSVSTATTVRRLYGTDVINFGAAGNAPQDGQVLTWVVEGSPPAGHWRASEPAVSTPPPSVTLAGDVTGTPEATAVSALRGVPVADFRTAAEAPENGDMLVYVVEGSPPVGTWRARPQPTRGDSGGTTSTSGSFVERPANLPAYSIVAAGIIPNAAPVYGGLRRADLADGIVVVGFDGYTVPDASFQYVLKAMPVVPSRVENLSGVVITFAEFGEKGCVLRVMNQGRPVLAADIEKLQLMIEVSRFEADNVR